jgi:DNA-binding NarL/FixJ family response regulator
MNGEAIRLVVKSRRRLVRDALCAYLAGRPDFSLVGSTGAIDSLAELCQLRRPHAVLVDSTELIPEKVDSLLQLRRTTPATEVVVTYDSVSPAVLEAAVRGGITTLVPGSRGLDVVVRALRERSRGDGVRRPDGRALTDPDLRIVSLLSTGHSVPEMANLLQISPRTVENRKRRLYVKLGVTSSSQAVARAASLGLTDPPPPDSQVRGEEAGRSPLAVVLGSAGPTLDRVQLALLAADVPIVCHLAPAPGRDHWAAWQRGPLLVVLVDPAQDDWRVPVSLRARTVVVLPADPDLATLTDILLRGASAILRGEDVDADLASVLSVVVRGYVALDQARVEGLIRRAPVVHPTGRATDLPALTARECDVLRQIANGRTIRQAARALGITAKTVENAQARLYRKLGVWNREEALTAAYRQGLLDRGDAPPGTR